MNKKNSNKFNISPIFVFYIDEKIVQRLYNNIPFESVKYKKTINGVNKDRNKKFFGSESNES